MQRAALRVSRRLRAQLPLIPPQHSVAASLAPPAPTRWLRQHTRWPRYTASPLLSSSSLLLAGVAAASLLLSSSASSPLSSAQAEEATETPVELPSTTQRSPHAAAPSRPFTSSPLYPHPTRPHVSIATAESLPELLSLRTSPTPTHLLVEVYSPHCPACERLSPVLDHVASILSTLSRTPPPPSYPSTSPPPPPYLVAVMDDRRNHLPSFLTPDEERYLPVLKLFPAPSSPTSPPPPPLTYRGPHNAAAILSFITSALSPALRPDPSTLAQLIRGGGGEVYERVRAVYRRQREEEVSRDGTVLLFDHSPCGEEMRGMMEWMILKGYRGGEGERGEVEREGREAMKGFQECVRGKKKETEEYWKSIRRIAQAQLDMDKGDEDGEEEDEEEEGGAQTGSEARSKAAKRKPKPKPKADNK